MVDSKDLFSFDYMDFNYFYEYVNGILDEVIRHNESCETNKKCSDEAFFSNRILCLENINYMLKYALVILIMKQDDRSRVSILRNRLAYHYDDRLDEYGVYDKFNDLLKNALEYQGLYKLNNLFSAKMVNLSQIKDNNGIIKVSGLNFDDIRDSIMDTIVKIASIATTIDIYDAYVDKPNSHANIFMPMINKLAISNPQEDININIHTILHNGGESKIRGNQNCLNEYIESKTSSMQAKLKINFLFYNSEYYRSMIHGRYISMKIGSTLRIVTYMEKYLSIINDVASNKYDSDYVNPIALRMKINTKISLKEEKSMFSFSVESK